MKAAGPNPAKILIAFVYWNAVRAGGIACFHYGRPRDEVDLDRLMKGLPMVEDYWNGDCPKIIGGSGGTGVGE